MEDVEEDVHRDLERELLQIAEYAYNLFHSGYRLVGLRRICGVLNSVPPR